LAIPESAAGLQDSSTARQSGRAFFEGLIRDHLDIGHPNKVVLSVDPS